MSITLRTISGKVYMPNGVAASGGRIVVELSFPATADDAGTAQRVAGRIVVPIAVTGDVSFDLVPNGDLIPTGTHYLFRYTITDPIATSWIETIQVPTGIGGVDIGDLTRLDIPVPLGLSLNDLLDVSVPNPADGQVVTFDAPSGLWVPAAGGGGASYEDLWRFRARQGSIVSGAPAGERWFSQLQAQNSGVTGTLFAGDQAYGILHVAPTQMTIDQVALNVTTASPNFQKKAIVGVYTNRADGDPWPDVLLGSSYLLPVTSTGVKTQTMQAPVVVPAGPFWLVWTHNDTVSTIAITAAGALPQNGQQYLGNDGSLSAPGSFIGAPVSFSGTGVLPDPFPTVSPALYSGNCPLIFFHLSA